MFVYDDVHCFTNYCKYPSCSFVYKFPQLNIDVLCTCLLGDNCVILKLWYEQIPDTEKFATFSFI